jgi:hypothetical protein
MRHLVVLTSVAVLATLLVANTARAQIPAPIGYWDFDSAAGGVAVDSSGNGNDGSILAAVTTSAGAPGGSTPGGGLSFPGNNATGRVQVPGININQIGQNGDYTIAGWISADHIPNESFFFGSTDAGVHHGLRTNGRLHFAHWGNDFSAATIVPTGAATDANSWVHAAFTYERATTTAKIYYNGVLDGTSNKGPPNNASCCFQIGSRHGGGGPSFTGQIDDVAVWTEIIPEADILALAQGASPIGIPEPSSILLAGLGLLGLVGFARRRRRA